MVTKHLFISAIMFISAIGFSQEMPLYFSVNEDSFTPFGNSGFSFRAAPDDTNNRVGEFTRSTVTNQGFYIDLVTPINLDSQKNITLSFYSFDPNNHSILLKLEQGDNNDVQVKESFSVPNISNWKTITFNFSEAKDSNTNVTVNATGNYKRLTLFIDEGSTTPGTFLINDINNGAAQTDPNELDVIYTDLVWEDDFNTNGAIDNTKWHHQTKIPSGGNWYNNEVQHYTNRTENANVSNGALNIVAIKETFNDQGYTKQYTSARLNSKFAFTYGRVDVKAKLPFGNGTWPAIWTLGKNINEDGGFWNSEFGTTSWPACGEIDVMEHGLHAVNEVSSALHTPSSFGNTMNTARKTLPNVAENFHIYSMNWSPDQITFLIDNVAYYTYKPSVKNDATWPFNKEQYLLLNVAMGGIAGTIDPNFTQSSMVIDYVKVYQNNPLSTSNLFKDEFSIYPNPTTNYINITTSKKVSKLELYSTLGKIVQRQKSNSKQLNTAHLKSGIYLLKIYADDKIATKKIIITN
jgi:beta-glucanase (GH16 family)